MIGTLRTAAKLALNTHWAGTPYMGSVQWMVPKIVEFLEARGRRDIDAITSEDLDAYIAKCKDDGMSPSYINKNLSALSTVCRLACERRPPLATSMPPIKRVRQPKVEQWWLRPEDLDTVVKEASPLMADLVLMLVMQGLRVREALALEPRHFQGLGGDRPMLKVPGTKTDRSGDAIPVFKEALPMVARSVVRAEDNGWTRLFPMSERQASTEWNKLRRTIGARDIASATLRSLRRTFAYYATMQGLNTRLLQKVLRHETITTTEGYLRLVGTDEAEKAREVLDKRSAGLDEAIAAYKRTGATPAEVAAFVKEVLQ